MKNNNNNHNNNHNHNIDTTTTNNKKKIAVDDSTSSSHVMECTNINLIKLYYLYLYLSDPIGWKLDCSW